jgi:hypothetical protein
MTLTEAKAIVKTNKVGKGCKLTGVSNKLEIHYPGWLIATEQQANDIAKVKELFAGNMINIGRAAGNKVCVNIWL